MASTTQTDDRPSDSDIIAYEKTLKAEFLAAPLVGPATDFEALIAEYADGANEAFKRKTAQLRQTGAAMRSVRKDGNCFYRGMCFALCEALINYQGSEWATKVRERILATRKTLADAGYDSSISEDFFEPLGEAIEPSYTIEKLTDVFKGEYASDTIVCYLRLVTAAELKLNRDMYEAFILDSYPTIEAFIQNQVEPMGIESDQIHIVAIANALGVTINVANLDASDADLNFHDISPMIPLELENSSSQPVLNLLYRPGHYDIVYLK
ncbi:peptidase C65 Otubain-domain-containing protein [Chytriomyces sp. MP71]|nr:peptidase C65 Otubain-domain-containing protein [Chytriomyces sp. MP71]